MFGNLVESTSHKGDNARTSWFFLGTLAVYTLVFLAIGVGGVYAYNTHIDTQNLELVSMITPIENTQLRTPLRSAAPKAAAANDNNHRPMSMRTEIIAPTTDPTKVPKGVSTTPQTVPEITTGLPVVRGGRNVDFGGGGTSKPGAGGLFGDNDNSDVGTTRSVGELVKDAPPPMIKKEVSKPPVKSIGVVNGIASYLPKPTYTAIAKAARASGTVTVQVLIDEHGKVISARAINGHPLLLKESVQSAYQARFTPTLLSNQPVKVSGVITYNFVLQ
jgi:periplasmic protein TonB